MGTRADFYLGIKPGQMEWIGSTAWDGFPDGFAGSGIFEAKTPEEFREKVFAMDTKRDDYTSPEMGWPWPWNDSHITDYAYAFDFESGKVLVCGKTWQWAKAVLACGGDDELIAALPSFGEPDFPDMTEIQNVNFGGRSGVFALGR